MKIGIFGHGTVGKAVSSFFKQYDHDVYIYDAKGLVNNFNVKKVQELEVVFLCVPTPTVDGIQDISAIKDCLNKITEVSKPIVIIKSSILLGTTDKLFNEYKIPILHSPEFLSENTTVGDFQEQENVYLGYPEEMPYKMALGVHHKLYTLFSDLPNIKNQGIFSVTAKVMEMVKYTANCFYATKVSYFNSIYRICEDNDIDYDQVRRFAIDSTGWMNEMHTQVPGRHGLGYSGKCFPDNMKALAIINPFIEMVDKYNEDIRDDKETK